MTKDRDHVRPTNDDPRLYDPEVSDSDNDEITEPSDTVYEDERDAIIATQAAEGIPPARPA